MWKLDMFGCELYYIFYLFFIFSFVGWIYESTLVSVKKKTFVNRGFLNGPIIPIYGCGVVAVYLSLRAYQDHLVVVFFAGIVVTTVLEYVTSFVMERLFHAKWWDYSEHKFNLQGRICLGSSLLWGVMSVLMMKVLQPLADKLICLIPRKQGEIAGDVLFLLFLCDLVVTCIHVVNFDHMLTRMTQLREDMIKYLEQSRVKENREDLITKISEYQSVQKVSELLASIKEGAERTKERLGLDKTNPENTGRLQEIEKRVSEFENRYRSFTAKFVQRRIMKAFPTMSVGKRHRAFAELKERLKNRKEM